MKTTNIILHYRGLPAIRLSGDKATTKRFKKDLIRVGRFVKKAEGITFEVTQENLEHWVETFNEMKKNGVRVSRRA